MISELNKRKGKPKISPIDQGDMNLISRLENEKSLQVEVDSNKSIKKMIFNKKVTLLAILAATIFLAIYGGYILFYSSNKLFNDSLQNVLGNEKVKLVNTEALAVAAQTKFVLEVSGYVVAKNKSSVSSDITGRIKEIFVDIGQEVAKDELIAVLDAREAQFLLIEKKLDYEKIKLDIERAQNEKSFLDKSFKRLQALSVAGSVSEETLDKIKQDKENARIHLEFLKLNLESAENKFKSAEIFVSRHMIKAPFKGIIVEVSARPGETVSPSSSGNSFIRTGIAQIVDPSNVYIEASVPEKYINQVKIGQAVEILMDGEKAHAVKASVLWVAPISNRQRGIIDVGIGLLLGVKGLLDGMEVTVRFMHED